MASKSKSPKASVSKISIKIKGPGKKALRYPDPIWELSTDEISLLQHIHRYVVFPKFPTEPDKREAAMYATECLQTLGFIPDIVVEGEPCELNKDGRKELKAIRKALAAC